MRRLLVVLISCYSHFLFVLRSSGSGDGLLLSCAPSVCANLRNFHFPFGAAAPCGASPSFLVSGCNNSAGVQQAYWEGFKEACPDGFGTLGPPAVMGIFQGLQSFVNLTWAHKSLDFCYPFSDTNISHYLPNSIDLRAFANSAFQFSDHNIYLLFNCNNNPSLSSIVEANSTECNSYLGECGRENINNCFKLKPDKKELMLQQVMQTFGCTRFMFFVTIDDSGSKHRSGAGMVQLAWTESNLPSDAACAKCEKTNGTCGYNVDHPDKFECFCPGGNQHSDTDCAHGSAGPGSPSAPETTPQRDKRFRHISILIRHAR